MSRAYRNNSLARLNDQLRQEARDRLAADDFPRTPAQQQPHYSDADWDAWSARMAIRREEIRQQRASERAEHGE